MKSQGRWGVFAACAVLSVAAFLVNCGSESSSSRTPDSGGDASADSTGSDVTQSTDAPPDVTDAAAGDAAKDSGFDAGPQFDDAGCPVPTGVVLDPADAGLPTTGLALWLRGDLGVAVRDGGVCRWDDVSGHGRSFAPATSTPPTVAAAGVNGKPAVAFNAGQALIRNDVLGLSATSGRTIAAFVANGDLTHRFQAVHQGKLGTAGTYFGLDTNTFDTAGSLEGVYVTNNAYDSNLATATTARSHILSISSFAAGGSLPGVLTYSVGGTAATLTRTAGGLGNGTVEDFSAADVTYLGGVSVGATPANLGEVLVYDRALTAPERTAVDQYFSSRYP